MYPLLAFVPLLCAHLVEAFEPAYDTSFAFGKRCGNDVECIERLRNRRLQRRQGMPSVVYTTSTVTSTATSTSTVYSTSTLTQTVTTTSEVDVTSTQTSTTTTTVTSTATSPAITPKTVPTCQGTFSWSNSIQECTAAPGYYNITAIGGSGGYGGSGGSPAGRGGYAATTGGLIYLAQTYTLRLVVASQGGNSPDQYRVYGAGGGASWVYTDGTLMNPLVVAGGGGGGASTRLGTDAVNSINGSSGTTTDNGDTPGKGGQSTSGVGGTAGTEDGDGGGGAGATSNGGTQGTHLSGGGGQTAPTFAGGTRGTGDGLTALGGYGGGGAAGYFAAGGGAGFNGGGGGGFNGIGGAGGSYVISTHDGIGSVVFNFATNSNGGNGAIIITPV